MSFDEDLGMALRAPNPIQEARALAQQLLAQGYGKASVVEMFEKARQQLRQAGRETDEDVVLDVLDFLVGWCSPHMRLDEDSTTANGPANFPGLREISGSPGSAEPRG